MREVVVNIIDYNAKIMSGSTDKNVPDASMRRDAGRAWT